MRTNSFEAIAAILFLIGMVAYGLTTGKMPASPVSSFVRDENRVGFWFMACFWSGLAVLGAYIQFVGPIL